MAARIQFRKYNLLNSRIGWLETLYKPSGLKNATHLPRVRADLSKLERNYYTPDEVSKHFISLYGHHLNRNGPMTAGQQPL